MDVAEMRITAAIVLAVATGAAGCSEGGAPAGSATIVVGTRSDFGSFNPITNSALYTGELINFALFTPLVQYDSSFGVVPHLAESWVEQGDSVVVFSLRRDVKWHDGVPVTAEDVAFTFERAKLAESASLIGSAFLASVASAQVIDSFTIRFRYSRPHAQALEDFWWAPAPKHLLESVAPAEMRNAPFNRAPVGSGPFRFVEWRAGDRLVLEPNPAFPAGLGGSPPGGRVVLRIVPEASTLATELATGAIHVGVPVLPDQLDRIRSDPGLRVVAYPGRTFYYIGWNNAREPFTDASVRRALGLAIDRSVIIDALLFGQGSLATSPIPPWSPVYPADVAPVASAVDEAKRLLDAAGWRDRDGDGMRENGAGTPLRFSLLSSDDQLRRSVVEVVREQLRAVGVAVEIEVVEFQTMIAAHRNRDFDAIFTNWILDNFQVASAPYALFHSSEAAKERSANRSTVRDTVLDRLIERGVASTDPGEQRQVWREFTLRLQQQQPVTFMFWLNEIAGVSDRLDGVVMDPRGQLISMARWHLSR